MALVPDLWRGWRDPEGLMRAKRGKGEGAALAAALGSCVLIFIAQWPRLAREATLQPEVPLEARLGGALLGLVFVLPLILYGVAAISQVALRLIGRPVSGLGARVALFWALLCITPLMLLHGLAVGFLGDGAAVAVLGLCVLASFGVLWGRMVMRVER